MKKAKYTIYNTIVLLRRHRLVRGKCDLSKKIWAAGPKQNIVNRKASGYVGPLIFPPF